MSGAKAFRIRGGEILYSTEQLAEGPAGIFVWEASRCNDNAAELHIQVQTRDRAGGCWVTAAHTIMPRGQLCKDIDGLERAWRVRYELAGPPDAAVQVATQPPQWRASA